MSFEMVKALARRIGVYPAARWVNRHVLDRPELSAFREDVVFYAQFVEPGGLCFDVGANYGMKTEVFLHLGAKVVAFEPQRDCMDELKSRLGRHPQLVTIDAAVGSQSGTGTLYVERHQYCLQPHQRLARGDSRYCPDRDDDAGRCDCTIRCSTVLQDRRGRV